MFFFIANPNDITDSTLIPRNLRTREDDEARQFPLRGRYRLAYNLLWSFFF